MRSLVRLVGALVLVVTAAAAANAQSVAEPKTVTVTPFASITFGPSHPVNTPDLGSSIGIGGAIGYDWTPNIGVEFELGRVFDLLGDDEALDYQLTTISGNFIYHFDVLHVTPYATVGLGWEHVGIDFDDPDAEGEGDMEFAWNFGGGVKVPLNSRVLLRADLRHFQGNDEAPDHWRVYGGVTFWIKR